MNDPRGSIWRKWDLHFHTPASFDYQNKSIADQEIINGLVKSEIGVVAITDHHVIDVPRVRHLQQLGEGKITVLPGIELRSELGGSESVHFIGIFSEDCNLDYVWMHLQTGLHISTDEVTAKGDQAIYCDLKEAAALIHSLDGIVTVHAGKKSNSIENIANTELFKMVLKKDLVTDSIDILEVGKAKDIESYETVVFPSIGKRLPVILGSDNHSIKKYSNAASCWINSDPGFRGLRQILVEPRDRVFAGERPVKLKKVSNNKTKYISQVSIHKLPGSVLGETWFDCDLPLNHGLVAIIGNKGSGKSALADILGLLGDSRKQEWFPFINDRQFRLPSGNRAAHFQAQIIWESGADPQRSLDQFVDPTSVEKVKYIPQNFFEVICNELAQDTEGDFDKELKNVIFSHVGESARLGRSSLDDLIAYRTAETYEAINIVKLELNRINEEIVSLEERVTREYRQAVRNKLATKTQELESHALEKPAPVAKPEQTEDQTSGISSLVDLAQKEREGLQEEIATAVEQQNRAAILESSVVKVSEKLSNFKQQYETLKKECSEYLAGTGLQVDDFIEVNLNEDLLIEKQKEFMAEKTRLEALLDANNSKSLIGQVKQIDNKLEGLRSKLDERDREYRDYELRLQDWESDRNLIIGDASKLGSVKALEAELQELDQLPAQLESAKEKRRTITQRIFAQIEKLAQVYGELYEPVQRFIAEHKLAKDKFQLNFDVSILISGFETDFFEWISHGAGGKFYGVEPGKKALKNIVDRYDFNEESGVLQFLSEIEESLVATKRPDQEDKLKISAQLRKDREVKDFYNFLYSLDYLKPRYRLNMGDKELNQLSPGEKGALLLIFYLLIDRDDTPLIIDQPEHNLDNHTVYDLLVPCIKEAKLYRQIILVTHNPNLAVVCDAEQVVCAALDKKDKNKVTYMSGAIENPDINLKIVDILEGTRPAFDIRDAKYF